MTVAVSPHSVAQPKKEFDGPPLQEFDGPPLQQEFDGPLQQEFDRYIKNSTVAGRRYNDLLVCRIQRTLGQ